MVFATGPLEASLRLPHPYPLTVDLDSGLWFRSEGQRLIFGLSNPADTGFAEGIDWPWLETTYEAALPRFPWFERLAIDRRASWWGYYEDTPDHNAILGRMPGAAGWINACGFSGHGVQQAAAVGKLIAQEALGEPPSIGIESLRIERFASAARNGGAERLIV
jgi:sarcosine oxidase subunit beta